MAVDRGKYNGGWVAPIDREGTTGRLRSTEAGPSPFPALPSGR